MSYTTVRIAHSLWLYAICRRIDDHGAKRAQKVPRKGNVKDMQYFSTRSVMATSALPLHGRAESEPACRPVDVKHAARRGSVPCATPCSLTAQANQGG